MKAMFRVIVVGAVIAVAGCAKHEPPPEAARPVVLAQVIPGSGAETAVFGLVLVVTMIAMPRGLVPTLRERLGW